MNIFKKTLYTTLIIILSSLTFYSIMVGINRHEINNCNKLKQQSEQFKDFYLTAWQSEMCSHHNIIINNK